VWSLLGNAWYAQGVVHFSSFSWIGRFTAKFDSYQVKKKVGMLRVEIQWDGTENKSPSQDGGGGGNGKKRAALNGLGHGRKVGPRALGHDGL